MNGLDNDFLINYMFTNKLSKDERFRIAFLNSSKMASSGTSKAMIMKTQFIDPLVSARNKYEKSQVSLGQLQIDIDKFKEKEVLALKVSTILNKPKVVNALTASGVTTAREKEDLFLLSGNEAFAPQS